MNRISAGVKDVRGVCENCSTGISGLCKALIGAAPNGSNAPISRDGRLSANLYLQRKGEPVADFKILKSGWAAMVQNTASGDRLIADFMLPGDVIGLGTWMKGSPFYSVQAISDVTYCSFDPRHIFSTEPVASEILQHLLERASDFNEQHQRRIFDIARRDAEARLLSLLLGLYERMEARGTARDGTMPFPLRQRHLADATGLTQVHVSRVLRKLRKDDLIDLSRKVLTFRQMDPIRDRLA